MKQKFAEGLLLSAVCVLAFAVMFGHFTGVKNIGLVGAALGLLAIAVVRPRRPPQPPQPPHYAPWPEAGLLVPLGLWMAWTLASLAWSVFPAASAAAWVDEVAIPTLGFFAFYRIGSIGRPALAAVRSGKAAKRARAAAAPSAALAGPPEDRDRADRPRYAALFEAACWIATFLLAALSVYGVNQLAPELPKPGLLHFYERVGHTSTFALIVLPLFLAMSVRPATRLAGISGVLLAGLIGLLSLNRFFGVSFVIALLIGLAPALRRRKIVAGVLMLGLLAGVAVVLTYSNSQRLPGSAPATPQSRPQVIEQAFDIAHWPTSLREMVAVDPRPQIWHDYVVLGERHPWLGVGFGKRLPAYAYGTSLPPALLTVEPHARTHAHDLFLNTWMQVGVVGLALECLLFVALIRAFLRTTPADIWLRAAGVALVCGVISKNLTDDFLWQSTSLAFWGHAGWLLGRARLSGMVRHRLASGRSVAMRRLRRVGN